MQSAEMNHGMRGRVKIPSSGVGLRWPKVEAATLRSILTLTVLSVVLLITAHPAQANESVLYNFTNNPDGANPESRLTLYGGNFYGTTYSGGLGYGTVFELSPNGSGGWTETVLYNFCSLTNCADGANPTYSYVTFDSLGNLYGTAYAGGANGDGVVFELSPGQSGWTESVLYSFTNSPDGANPVNGLVVDAGGNLYGTTYAGGSTGNGAVFELSPSGGNWTEQVIYDISSTYAGLAVDGSGNLFGVSWSAAFKLSPNGSGGWNPTVIYHFTNPLKNGSDLNGTPVLDRAGNVYGTAYAGGASNSGLVYKLSLGKGGKWTEKVLHTFGNYGANPLAGVVFDSSGNMYGTTTQWGPRGASNVYELSPNGSGGYTFKVVAVFNGENGGDPYGSLILDSAGYLYGTTYGGGPSGYGTVFASNPSPTATTITLTSSPNPSTYGQLVTFTATVTPAPPDGELVTIKLLGQAPLQGGVAIFQTSTLPVGITKTRAEYFGDLEYQGGHSSWVHQVVKQ